MKKVYIVVCLLVVMTAMIACTPDEGMPAGSLGSSPSDVASSEPIKNIEPTDIADEEKKEDRDPNQYSENIMPLPKDTEKLFGFNPEALLLGKTYKEIKDACPDLVYADYFMGSEYFYSTARKIFFMFGSIDMLDIDNPNESAICNAVYADAEIIFPDIGTDLSKSEIEVVIGVEVEIINNAPGTELIGEYIASFEYKGFDFEYLPKDKEENILPDKQISVWWMP